MLLKSSTLGWNFDFPRYFNATLSNRGAGLIGEMPDGVIGVLPALGAAIFPDISERNALVGAYAELRDGILNGAVDPHAVRGYPVHLTTAVENGDLPMVDALTKAFRTDTNIKIGEENGVRYIKRWPVSGWWSTLAGLFGRHGSWYDLINRGNLPAWDQGPILEEVPYPDVLIARAVTDGTALEVVAHPGGRAGRFPFEFARLAPGAAYSARANGQPIDFIADATGRAVVTLDVNGRTEISLCPAIG